MENLEGPSVWVPTNVDRRYFEVKSCIDFEGHDVIPIGECLSVDITPESIYYYLPDRVIIHNGREEIHEKHITLHHDANTISSQIVITAPDLRNPAKTISFIGVPAGAASRLTKHTLSHTAYIKNILETPGCYLEVDGQPADLDAPNYNIAKSHIITLIETLSRIFNKELPINGDINWLECRVSRSR